MDDGKRPAPVQEETSPGSSGPEPPARPSPPAERPGGLDAESELDDQPAPGSHYEPL